MTTSIAYRHPEVRDLAWVIHSPPLFQNQPFDLDWTDSSLDGWLRELDQDPQPLLDRLAEQTDHRLGHRFETFLEFALEKHPRYQILAHNLQIRDGTQTIGEFDFVLLDREQNKRLHMEVACKFYLGLGDTRNTASWHGPMLRDRLDRKLDHMARRQSRLAQHPVARQKLDDFGWPIDASTCLMKGRLFYPLHQTNAPMPNEAAPDHARGHWCFARDFRPRAAGRAAYWQKLNKNCWFSIRLPDPTMPRLTAEDIETLIVTEPDMRPLCLAGFPDTDQASKECERLFIVPDHWAPAPTHD